MTWSVPELYMKVRSNNTAIQTPVQEPVILSNGLKQTHKVIEIKVNVDDIADKLLNTFPEDYKHRVLLTETIIGSAVNAGNISYIYNALNGYTAEIDFKVGEMLICSAQERRQTNFTNVNEGKFVDNEPVAPKWERKNSEDVEIGECQIVEIDIYRDDKIKVRFMQDSYYTYGSQEMTDQWVNHRTCQKVNIEPVDVSVD